MRCHSAEISGTQEFSSRAAAFHYSDTIVYTGMKEAQTVTDFADASHSKSAKSTATTVLYGIFSSENSYLCAMTKHVQYTLLLYIRKATVYNNYRSFAVGYCSRLAQTVTDFADASHSKSAKSTTTTVLYGIFSSENSYPCTVTRLFLSREDTQ